MIIGLTLAALLLHALPLGLLNTPDPAMGAVALLGMGVLYLCMALLQARPLALEAWRRWSYAGFYVDEYYTRLALWLWPTGCAPSEPAAASTPGCGQRPEMTSGRNPRCAR